MRKKAPFPEYPENIVSYYTEGRCWSLAWQLSKLGDLPIVTVGPSARWWYHVVVQPSPRRYLDIEGVCDKKKLRSSYGSGVRSLGRFATFDDYLRVLLNTEYESVLEDFDDPFVERTREIAKEILACVS